ncbi:McrB family protein [Chitinophaga lutea]|nr:DUF3578 domain-containing protein [Chitinophaga lutea]
MAIPNNLTHDHFLKAVDLIDRQGVPPGAQSKVYDAVWRGKRYPPKLLVSYANLFANGIELDRDSFPGGMKTRCFKLLLNSGFTIIKKEEAMSSSEANSISSIVFEFLDRVHNDPKNLKKANFEGKIFEGLKIVAGFGQGNTAKIPWIALLADDQKVSEGIYPVYLYFIAQQRLVLAYGISETREPPHPWPFKRETVQAFFKSNEGVSPKRYGSSYYFKDYSINKSRKNYGLESKILEDDIEELVLEYKEVVGKMNKRTVEPNKVSKRQSISEPFECQQFVSSLNNTYFKTEPGLVRRFIAALATKPFVILTGLSGSGKTRIAISFAKWISKDHGRQVCVVPVGADWTNREPLLGFPNMQKEKTYVSPENGVLDLIISASEDPTMPYFLILDEMNLSHVERYFADFLSCMESGEEICLHPGPGRWNEGRIPSKLKLPNNLFVIGTVNIDETTYMFSPKVLDRASVIEFKVSTESMIEFLRSDTLADVRSLEGQGNAMAQEFVKLATTQTGNFSHNEITNELIGFYKALKAVGAEFGFRTAAEIKRFITVAKEIDQWENADLIDCIIMQKLLPRLHGSRRKLEQTMEILAKLCLKDSEKKVLDYLNQEVAQTTDSDLNIRYRLSLEKIKRMYKSLVDQGFTSYAEA